MLVQCAATRSFDIMPHIFPNTDKNICCQPVETFSWQIFDNKARLKQFVPTFFLKLRHRLSLWSQALP